MNFIEKRRIMVSYLFTIQVKQIVEVIQILNKFPENLIYTITKSLPNMNDESKCKCILQTIKSLKKFILQVSRCVGRRNSTPR